MSACERATAPWSRAAPMSAVSPNPRPSPTYEIRVLSTGEELVESYRLRYDVYRALGYLQRENDARLDIDEYDASSIPFGAFDTSSEAMIGTLRLVTTEPQPDYDYMIRYIVSNCSDAGLARQAWGPHPHPLPSIVSRSIDREVERFNTDQFPLSELSRCIVHPDRRRTGVSRGLMEFGLAYAMQTTPRVIVGSCLSEHVAMYARYGYAPLPYSEGTLFDSVGQIANAVICRTDRIPEPTRGHIDELLATAGSGGMEHTREIGRGSRVVYRFAAPRRARRQTFEW